MLQTAMRDSSPPPLPLTADRIVAVRSSNGAVGYCSGIALTPTLVLTASHSIQDWGEPNYVQVRQLSTGVWVDADVLHPEEGIVCLRPQNALAIHSGMPSIGVYVGFVDLPCILYGFAEALVVDGSAELWQSTGVVLSRGGRKDGRVHVDVHHYPTARENLRGCSGGPIQVGGAVVGLIEEAVRGFDARRIEAILLSRSSGNENVSHLRFQTLDGFEFQDLTREEARLLLDLVQREFPELSYYVNQIW